MRGRLLGVALVVGCGPTPAEFRAEECRADALPIVDPGPGEISWTTQVVRLNILPEAYEAIDALGLAPVEDQIIEGIRMHVRDGFTPYDFAVVLDDAEAAEANLEQLMTFDVVGDDPNRLGLMARVTMTAKDTGNVTRNEHFGPSTRRVRSPAPRRSVGSSSPRTFNPTSRAHGQNERTAWVMSCPPSAGTRRSRPCRPKRPSEWPASSRRCLQPPSCTRPATRWG